MTEESAAGELPLSGRIQRLQRIVGELERDDIELDDALRLFEEGVAHLRAAETLVARAELMIERLLDRPDGPELVPVEEPE